MKNKLLVISCWLLGLFVLTAEAVLSVLPVIPVPVGFASGGNEHTNSPTRKLYETMLYPCVRISSPSGIGSGVIIHRRDAKDAEKSIYILSAAHVVGDYSAVTVTVYSYHRGDAEVAEEIQANVVLTDTTKDLALLRALCVSAVKPAKLAPKDYTYYLFTPVYAVGCSLGLEPRPSSGILSALSVSAVEISAPILPGNSGGPVYDAKTHKLIGIAVWVRVYNGQLVTTMAGVVPIQQIYEFLTAETQSSQRE